MVVAGLVIPETFRTIIVFPGKTVVDILETVMLCPDALQPTKVDKELLADRAAVTEQGPPDIVILAGRVTTTTAPTPKEFLVWRVN